LAIGPRSGRDGKWLGIITDVIELSSTRHPYVALPS
jgi:hypothetical protein